MNNDNTSFHQQTAESLAERYQSQAQAPEGWRETAVWHWRQAHKLVEAATLALDVVETRITRLDFIGARHWAEQALTMIDALQKKDYIDLEIRACTLTLVVLEFGGQYREGIEFAYRLLTAVQMHGSVEGEARAYLTLGRMQREAGQLVAAENALRTACTLANNDELNDLESEARIHLAKVHHLQGRHLEALQQLQISREEYEQNDNRIKLAQVFTSIGDVYRVLGSSQEALSLYMRALSFEQSIGSLLGQAILKDKLALVMTDQKRFTEALGHAEESLSLRMRLHDVVGEARACTVLGIILGYLDRTDEALDYLRRANLLQQQVQNPRGQRIALSNLGDIECRLQRFDDAIEHYEEAMTLARQEDDKVGIAQALRRYGDLRFMQGNRDKANIHWAEALKLREQLGHVDEVIALRERLQGGPPR